MEVPVNTAFRRRAALESLEAEIEALEQAPEPDPKDSRYEVIRHIVETLGQTHFIMAMFNGLEWPRFGQTEEESWMNLVLHPEICAKIAELQGIQMLREARLCARLGVDGLMAVGDLGTSQGLTASPRLYRSLCYPWQKAQAEEARRWGLKVLRHCCGHVMPIIDELAEINDVYEAIQPTAGMDICELKQRVGDRLCLWGGIWHEHIHGGTPEDIRSDARTAFACAGPGGGFIMGSSHSLAVGARLENILEMKRLRDTWGIYPLEPDKWG
jgi:uroporphyrinogen decarboxylase